jgi:hypothetical protein
LHYESRDVPLKTAVADLAPIAFVHHGVPAYTLFRTGKSAVVRDYVKRVHDLGIRAGVSIQDPQDLERIADEGWEDEFFMTPFHNLRRTIDPHGERDHLGRLATLARVGRRQGGLSRGERWTDRTAPDIIMPRTGTILPPERCRAIGRLQQPR